MCCCGSTMFSWTQTSDFFCFHQWAGGRDRSWKRGKKQNKFLQLQLPPEGDPPRTLKTTPWPCTGWESSTAAAYGDLSSERAAKCLEQELETDQGPTALGWDTCGISNTNRDKLVGFFFFILNDPHQWISNSSKGAPQTPATTWFTYNAWAAIPVLSLATNEIKKAAQKMVPLSAPGLETAAGWLFFTMATPRTLYCFCIWSISNLCHGNTLFFSCTPADKISLCHRSMHWPVNQHIAAGFF